MDNYPLDPCPYGAREPWRARRISPNPNLALTPDPVDSAVHVHANVAVSNHHILSRIPQPEAAGVPANNLEETLLGKLPCRLHVPMLGGLPALHDHRGGIGLVAVALVVPASGPPFNAASRLEMLVGRQVAAGSLVARAAISPGCRLDQGEGAG